MSSSQRLNAWFETNFDELYSQIDKQVLENDTWSISLERVCEIFGTDKVEAYRSLYREKQLISGYIPDLFDFENVRDLIALLSNLCDTDAEGSFQTTGVYFNHDDTAELAAVYYDEISKALATHTVDTETFAQMLDRFKRLDRAFAVYREYFFDVDSIAESAIASFLQSRPAILPRVAEYTAHRVFKRLMERHIVSPDALFESLYNKLRGDREPPRSARSYDPALAEALNAFGLGSLPDTLEDLRSHYKALMKTYHPDLNPNGLEISKRINSAYSELLTRVPR